MGDKRLNFNRPLLSVRRFSPTVANSEKDSRRNNGSSTPALLPSPTYKSELLSGPLRNPGTVPFVWEQSPGRPKDETKTQKLPIVPNPPPGWVLKPKKHDFDVITEGFYVKKGSVEHSFERSEDSNKERPHSSNDDDGDNGNSDMSREIEKPRFTYGPNFLQFNDDDDDDDDEDDEDDRDFEYDGHGNVPLKFCGLLPQFCLKGSVGMLNQTPGLSVRTRLPVSSSNRARVGASSANCQDARLAAYEPKSSVNNQKDSPILNHESKEDTNQKNSQKLEQGHGISDTHNELCPPPFVSEEKQLNIQKKGLLSFQELLAYEIAKETNFENPTVEKTLYVDTVHKVESLKSEFNEIDVDIFGISRIPTKLFRFDSVAHNSKHDKEMITQTGVCNRPKIDQKVKVSQNPWSGLLAPPCNRPKVDHKVKVSQNPGSELPAPPPLPKSPSDSWLWRTLPSVNSKTVSLWSNHKQSSKTTMKQGKYDQSLYPQGL